MRQAHERTPQTERRRSNQWVNQWVYIPISYADSNLKYYTYTQARMQEYANSITWVRAHKPSTATAAEVSEHQHHLKLSQHTTLKTFLHRVQPASTGYIVLQYYLLYNLKSRVLFRVCDFRLCDTKSHACSQKDRSDQPKKMPQRHRQNQPTDNTLIAFSKHRILIKTSATTHTMFTAVHTCATGTHIMARNLRWPHNLPPPLPVWCAPAHPSITLKCSTEAHKMWDTLKCDEWFMYYYYADNNNICT